MDTDSIIVKVNGKQEIPDEKLPFDKTDTETGIRVEAKDDVISNEADLKVDKIESGSIYDYVLNIIKDIGKVFISYDIFVEVNGEKVQPTGGNAKVTIPIPSDYNKDNLLLYLINSKGEKISIEFLVKDNNIIFESDLLGIYSLVDTSKGDGKPDLDDDKEEETEDKPQVKPDNKPNNNGSNSGNNNLPATGNEVSMYILTFAILAVAIGYILLLNKKKVRK
ncbi:MAG: LPXTG cell wall anchor domain-containing protein [Clostridium celatum]|nr:LPXTG cell wall anchor domain-containing protein [Clostridium celatum]